jgi:hypothetical protein
MYAIEVMMPQGGAFVPPRYISSDHGTMYTIRDRTVSLATQLSHMGGKDRFECNRIAKMSYPNARLVYLILRSNGIKRTRIKVAKLT